MTGKALLILISAMFFFGCASTGQATGSLTSRAQQAATLAHDAYDDNGPGAAYLISQNGHVLISGSVGYANLEWNGEMTADTAIRIGSLSKPITAGLVLQLVEQDLIDLDEPVIRYAPKLPEQFGAITMRQLLSHRSGLTDFLLDPSLIEHVWLPMTTDKMIELAKDAPVSFSPEEKYEYVNFNYVIVAHVIEKVTGRSYEDVVNAFFAEHNMPNSHFDTHAVIIKNRAAAYELRDGASLNSPGLDLSHLSAAGALLSSAQDLNRWADQLTTGALINTQSLDMAWTPRALPDETATTYGLGFNESEFCGARIIWHTGLAPGGQAAFMLAPEEGIFTVVLSNAYNTPSTGKLSRQMMATMLTGDADAPCAAE